MGMAKTTIYTAQRVGRAKVHPTFGSFEWFAWGMTEFPMFPLGTVLFPSMPLPLRVFEPRYLTMLAEILPDEPSEFGVVLIERGSEVGGGEHRFPLGTIARIINLDAAEDFVVLVAEGTHRVEVTQWLSDDPYPRAEVRVLEDLVWSDALLPLRDRAERAVRALLALATELTGDGCAGSWPPSHRSGRSTRSSCWARPMLRHFSSP
jgi:Lon protease-like protein